MYLDQTFHQSGVSEKVALEITEETLIKFRFSDDNKWPILFHMLKLQALYFWSKLFDTEIITFFRYMSLLWAQRITNLHNEQETCSFMCRRDISVLVSRYSDSLRAGRSGNRIPVGGEIFSTRPERAWRPPSPLYCTMDIGSFPGVKWPGRGVDHPPSSSAEVKGRVELCLYPPPLSIRGLF